MYPNRLILLQNQNPKNLEKMKPKEVLEKWIDCFNKADAYHIAELYATDAVNHQVANEPIIGKESIYKMFVNEFATAKMVCMVENIFAPTLLPPTKQHNQKRTTSSMKGI